MSVKYFAILTHQGAAKLANATALGTTLNLTQLAIGDGNGTLPVPDAAQTRLINQTRIAPLNALSVDPENPSQIVAEQIIPENEGGYWIRELGLFDDAGVLIAVANCPETYKPQLQEGSGRTQTIRMVVVVSSTAAVTLKIDPSVVLATRKYADDLLAGHLKAANPHPQYLQIADIASFTPVGVPLPYPSATPPAGWFKCNGAAFNKGQYPKLAALFPSGNLPDLRGEFIRGWDDGRAVDSGRALLSSQADEIKKFTLKYLGPGAGTGSTTVFALQSGMNPIYTSGISQAVNSPSADAFQIPGGNETRPRNVAFSYIVRAA